MAWTEEARKKAAETRKRNKQPRSLFPTTSRVLKNEALKAFGDLSKGGHFSQPARNVLARNAKFFAKTYNTSIRGGYMKAISAQKKVKSDSSVERSTAQMVRENLSLTYRNPRRPR